MYYHVLSRDTRRTAGDGLRFLVWWTPVFADSLHVYHPPPAKLCCCVHYFCIPKSRQYRRPAAGRPTTVECCVQVTHALSPAMFFMYAHSARGSRALWPRLHPCTRRRGPRRVALCCMRSRCTTLAGPASHHTEAPRWLFQHCEVTTLSTHHGAEDYPTPATSLSLMPIYLPPVASTTTVHSVPHLLDLCT